MTIPSFIIDLDRADSIGSLRDEFLLPPDTVYMDGNSLGPLTRASRKAVAELVDKQWGQDLVESWNKHHWIDLPLGVGNKIASLIGAEKGQVIACDSTSINMFKVLSSALRLQSERTVVLSQRENFPTDLYMAQGLSELLGEQRCTLSSVNENDLLERIDENVAVLMLTHVDFRSGKMHDIEAITQRAHRQGVIVVWDLAHSAGALELKLDAWNVDFAVGCGYKYLNGGPGSPAFIYAAKRHHSHIVQPLSGWMGHSQPFEFEHDYHPGSNMLRFLSGTPNILSMVALDAALDLFERVSFTQLRAKSLALSALFIDSLDQTCRQTDLSLESPLNESLRGSHLAYSHPQAFAISQALIDRNIVVDYRAPNMIRFGFTPLYQRYCDVWRAAEILKEILENRSYDDPKYSLRSKVT